MWLLCICRVGALSLASGYPTISLLFVALLLSGFAPSQIVRLAEPCGGTLTYPRSVAATEASLDWVQSPTDTSRTSVRERTSAAEDPVLKGVAEGALSIVALGFAAFTFLYNTLLVLTGPPEKVEGLKKKLRRALYATVFAIVSSAVLAVMAFAAIEWKLRVLGDVAIFLAVVVLAVLSGVALSMASDVRSGV